MAIKLEKLLYPGQAIKFKLSKPYYQDKSIVVDETELDDLFEKIKTIKNEHYVEKPQLVLDRLTQKLKDEYESFARRVKQVELDIDTAKNRLIEQDDRLGKHGKSIMDLYDVTHDIDTTTTELYQKVMIEMPNDLRLVKEILKRNNKEE